MLIIGERINATRLAIKEALEARDGDHIRGEARAQAEAGAAFIDVNGGVSPEVELDNLVWLCEQAQGEVELPLSIDSASPPVIAAGLKAHKNGRALVNSISMEAGKYEDVLPLVKEHDARVVALAMDDEGIPRTASDRLRVIERIVDEAGRHGVALSDVFIDPLVMALSADVGAGRLVMDVLAGISERWPDLQTTCGLSNISFGLPKRGLVNRTFLSMLMAHGLSSAIVDPLDEKLMAAVTTANALMGGDDFCMDYLGAFRGGKLEV